MVLVITGLYTSLTAMIAFVLTFYVIKLRRKLKIGVGTRGNIDMQVATRAHANLLEGAPLALLLLLIAEANGLQAIALHGFGLLWIFARVVHPIGLIRARGGIHVGRFLGTVGTWFVITGLVLTNLFYFLFN